MQQPGCKCLQANRSEFSKGSSGRASAFARRFLANTVAIAAVFLFAALAQPRSAFAQEIQAPVNPPPIQVHNTDQQPSNDHSFLNLGLLWGRSGAANGPTGFFEFDPMHWFGVGLFASESSGAQNMYGGRASGWSFTGGLLFTGHLPEMRGFRISPFAQVGFNHDHGRLIIPLGNGLYWSDGDNPERYTWTVGPSIERRLFKNGPLGSFRIGKNFGPVTAAQHGGGIYAVAGLEFPLDHPVRLLKSFARF